MGGAGVLGTAESGYFRSERATVPWSATTVRPMIRQRPGPSRSDPPGSRPRAAESTESFESSRLERLDGPRHQSNQHPHFATLFYQFNCEI